MISSNEPNNSGAGAAPVPPQKRRTIYIECTHTYHSDINTGIQRVVRNVLRNAPAIAAKYNMQVVPVIIENSRFRIADTEPVLRDKQAKSPRAIVSGQGALAGWSRAVRKYISSVLSVALAPFPNEFYWYMRSVIAAVLPFAPVRRFLSAPRSEFGLTRLLYTPIRLLRLVRGTPDKSPPCGTLNSADSLLPAGFSDHHGDILLLLDSSWSVPLWNATRAFKQQGAMVIGVIYDLIPITHPHACIQELTTAFTDWLRQYCRVSDGTMTISKSVKLQFETYTRLCYPANWSGVNAPVCYFHLGSELDLADRDASSPRMSELFAQKLPTFLVVGSIEPRKNHTYVLDAFEKLWAAGQDVRLVIIGKQAWRTEDFLKRVDRHSKLHEKLYVFRDASDAELEQCYRNADALVIASEIEGFGLPIVEAFQRGLPVICSDIPVFREIGGDSVAFFELDDPIFLSSALEAFIQKMDGTPRRATDWMTWYQSTEELFKSIDEMVVTHKARSDQPELHGSDKVA